jgi:hypothetical protein
MLPALYYLCACTTHGVGDRNYKLRATTGRTADLTLMAVRVARPWGAWCNMRLINIWSGCDAWRDGAASVH